MASISKRQDGTREIYILNNGKRSRIQLGRMPKKDALSLLTKIEHIISKKLCRLSLDTDVAEWLGSLSSNEPIFQRLVLLEVVEARAIEPESLPNQSKTLQSIVDRFTDFKRPMIAESSLNKLVQCLDVLVECFGKDRDISKITLGDASEFESWGMKRGFSDAHQRTHNRYAKQLHSYAVDHAWIEDNPFRKLKSTSLSATTRHYVTPEDTVSLLEACPGLQWKLLIGLARYAGLRVPSEAFAFRWQRPEETTFYHQGSWLEAMGGYVSDSSTILRDSLRIAGASDTRRFHLARSFQPGFEGSLLDDYKRRFREGDGDKDRYNGTPENPLVKTGGIFGGSQ